MAITTMEERKRGRPAGSGFGIPPAQVAKLQAEGKSINEIADTLKVSTRTVGTLLAKFKTSPLATETESRLDRFNTAIRERNQRALDLLDQWEPENIQSVTLDITGQMPLRFTGFEIRSGSTQWIDCRLDKDGENRPNDDYWTVTIYQVIDGRHPYAVAFTYVTTPRKREIITRWAEFTDDPVKTVTAFDNVSTLRGYPDDEKFDGLQEKLERNSKHQYAQLVSTLLRRPF